METEGMRYEVWMINGSSKSSSEADKRFKVVIHVEQRTTRISLNSNIPKLKTEIANYSIAFNFSIFGRL